MQEVNFFLKTHNSSKREYAKYMNFEKPDCMSIAKKYSKEFFDGDRKYGYGGYKYLPNRWNDVVNNIQKFYNLDKYSKILDAGAGKGFFIKDLKDRIYSNKIYGFDISEYAVKHCHDDIRDNFFIHDIRKKLEFNDKYFDLLTCFGVLHNLKIFEIKKTIQELNRVSKRQYIWVESYRSDKELFNLQCWAKTCESFFTPDEWIWVFKEFGYSGEYEFIYFE
ncbi:class I SAM-dependent methyltransferase [Alphaproteobacteria bacterium]|nr:class I SAM-dependent methyltransferase [Alphaproteobacteria bacterium]